ncbi:GNAT family N-acetyltransferase [uncultured Ruminococcus sp.]|uniref:GNAT family N-acetyltransferase n=1 Tax=uncultured Ruminococcus sp. TaxID=165186 RepID=UPI00258E0D9D|nr:GNAT family N-acetyltransferase [uncultured Ruminococcus sp.]
MNNLVQLEKVPFPLNNLIEKEGILNYINDYYVLVNGNFNMLYAVDDFYIAENLTYQPWLAVMGTVPSDLTEDKLRELLRPYIENEKYIAVYTNNKLISKLLSEFSIFTYHEDFINGQVNSKSNFDYSGIRLATENDLSYIEKTYTRSGHNQLLNRINQKQMWVLEDNDVLKGYMGVHKDSSLGFQYVDPNARRQNITTRLQSYVVEQVLKDNKIPFFMVSLHNEVALNFQKKLGSTFATKLFYFYAKGPYELE